MVHQRRLRAVETVLSSDGTTFGFVRPRPAPWSLIIAVAFGAATAAIGDGCGHNDDAAPIKSWDDAEDSPPVDVREPGDAEPQEDGTGACSTTTVVAR